MMPLSLLLPDLAGLQVDDLTADPEHIEFYTVTIHPQANFHFPSLPPGIGPGPQSV